MQPPLALIAAKNDVATVPFGTVVVVIVTGDARHGAANNSKRGRVRDFMRHVDMTAFLPTDYKSAETAAPKAANLLLFQSQVDTSEQETGG